MTFITMMVARLAGPNGSPLGALGGTDANLTMHLVVYGYFFITLIQIIGILTNDRSPVQVLLSKNEMNKELILFLFSECVICSLWIFTISRGWCKNGLYG